MSSAARNAHSHEASLVSTPLAELIDAVSMQWRLAFPTLAVLRTATWDLEADPELTPQATVDWLDAIGSARARLQRVKPTSVRERMYAQSLAGFLDEEVARWTGWLHGDMEMTATVVAAGLLPFTLLPRRSAPDIARIRRRVRGLTRALRSAMLGVRRPWAGASVHQRIDALAAGVADLALDWGRHDTPLTSELRTLHADVVRMGRHLRPRRSEGVRATVVPQDRGARPWMVRDLGVAVQQALDEIARSPMPDLGHGGNGSRVLELAERASTLLRSVCRMEAPPIAIRPAARLAQSVAGNALYVRGSEDVEVPPTLLLATDRLSFKNHPLSLTQQAYIVLVAAHEVAPGHHAHFAAVPPCLRKRMDVLRSPVGLEGWAVRAEAAAIRLESTELGFLPLRRTMWIHRTRRLLSALEALAPECGLTVRRRVAETVDAHAAAIITQAASCPAEYGVGLVEVERALAAIRRRVADEPVAEELFMREGPLPPSLVAAILSHELESLPEQAATVDM